MQNYWPPKTKASTSNLFLWEHEWESHGQDYAELVYKLRPEDFPGTLEERNKKLQLAYFNDGLDFYKRFNVKKLVSGKYSKSDFA